jgi:hypothetical protein
MYYLHTIIENTKQNSLCIKIVWRPPMWVCTKSSEEMFLVMVPFYHVTVVFSINKNIFFVHNKLSKGWWIPKCIVKLNNYKFGMRGWKKNNQSLFIDSISTSLNTCKHISSMSILYKIFKIVTRVEKTIVVGH